MLIRPGAENGHRPAGVSALDSRGIRRLGRARAAPWCKRHSKSSIGPLCAASSSSRICTHICVSPPLPALHRLCIASASHRRHRHRHRYRHRRTPPLAMSRSHARSPSPSSSDDDDDGSPYQITEPPAPALAPVIPFWSQEYTLSASASLKGDRIRLCSSALHELLQLTSETAVPPVVLPSPTTFELQSTDHRRIKVYATVEEYTADEDQIQVPLSIWEAFVPSQSSAPTSTPARSELEPGPADNVSRSDDPMQTDHPAASVRVKLVELPKCIWARIAPMEPDYLEIANMRATLETYFRKFQTTVTKGEILRVPHINPKTKQLKEHGFIVADLKPADACLCLNTDMEVDIAPLDASIAEEAVRLKFTTNIGPVRSDNSGRNQVLYPDTDAQHPTELKAVVEGAVQKGRYMHYSTTATVISMYRSFRSIPRASIILPTMSTEEHRY
ncbi:ubiquitin fusion degradation protein UFD1-domain-containing protein [Polychytrium aggregatum]|uniref:ubiquitin fusion degradation protein UFD1-domain-containing protein n=1 Tax=Polychytrium aggregatum TaxID=110093 RepID=UPI0022FE465D|nr:ubiquitin fusion degradation protein UFD1-domain-containing protein [Polychytrium aggregatum]KAI9206190.1 ubiquitin fusion degradation protein UFD1-domain-containing protein [Polychytrium aggregatum]